MTEIILREDLLLKYKGIPVCPSFNWVVKL